MTSASHPNIAEPTAPLEALAIAALRRYGDGAATEADGGLLLMFLDLANEVVEDVRHHPYWPKDEPLPYYVSLQDTRPIPDPIVINGLLAHYCVQQGSQRAATAVPRYRQLMNQVLWNRLSGSGPIRMRVVDNGSNAGRAPQIIDPVTGQVVPPDPDPPTG